MISRKLKKPVEQEKQYQKRNNKSHHVKKNHRKIKSLNKNQNEETKYAKRTSKVISSQTQEQLDEVRESFQWRKIRKKRCRESKEPWGWSLNMRVANSSGSKPKPGTDCKAL